MGANPTGAAVRLALANHYSPGPLVFVAGTTGTLDGRVVAPGDDYAQTRQALANIEAALALAGAHLSDVVQTRLSVTDISMWEEVGRAHCEAFAGAGVGAFPVTPWSR